MALLKILHMGWVDRNNAKQLCEAAEPPLLDVVCPRHPPVTSVPQKHLLRIQV